MSKFVISGLVAALPSVALLSVAAGDEIPVDVSSPEACFATFMKAFEAGDWAALSAASQGTARQRQWLRTQSAQWHALRQLETALAERFGQAWQQSDSGQRLADKIHEMGDEDLHDDLKRAKPPVAENGRALIVVNEGDADELQPWIVLSENQWKLDLSSLSQYMGAQDAPILEAVARAAAALARSVAAGEFASVDEAGEAISAKLSSAAEPQASTQPVVPNSPREKRSGAAQAKS